MKMSTAMIIASGPAKVSNNHPISSGSVSMLWVWMYIVINTVENNKSSPHDANKLRDKLVSKLQSIISLSLRFSRCKSVLGYRIG